MNITTTQKTKKSVFFINLFEELITNLNNNYSDNFNTYTSRHYEQWSLKKNILDILHNLGILFSNKINSQQRVLLKELQKIEPYLAEFSSVYDFLEDEHSRNLLVQIVAYRILGARKYKLALNNPTYWKKLQHLEEISQRNSSNNSTIDPSFMDWKLSEFKIAINDHDIKLYYTPYGVLNTFILKQYECPTKRKIKANPGDVVIDAGGCWGDTALYFANEVGESGQVYTFEFIPSNLNIMLLNFDCNPQLKKRIEIVKNPIWSESKQSLYCLDRGPASCVSFEPISNPAIQVSTISLDDFIQQYSLVKVDLIKMDIEGSELSALKGAVETIKKYRPKLAISIYHSLEDIVEIPKFIHELDLGYKFYLGHFTIHNEETVLYAISTDEN